MRVLILYPAMDIEWDRVKACEVNVRRPSLGLGYLMAVLRKADIPFKYMDMVASKLALRDVIEELKVGGYTTVALHANSSTKDDVCRIIAAVNEHTNAKTLIGGPGGVRGREFMEGGADCVCVGEAEVRFVPILRALHGEGSLTDILGILYRDATGEIVETGDPPFIEDLDSVPFPYRPRDFVPLFGEPVNPAVTGTYISLIASRGCPYKCTFCYAHQVWEHKVRFRSPDNVLDEMAAEQVNWPDAYFTFVDDVWGLENEWAIEFCKKKIERGLTFKWMCIIHPLSFGRRRAEIMELMARAGCNCISYGAQSSDPGILKAIQRSPKEPAELAEALALCRKHSILSIVTWIFGLPGETHETVKASIDWCLKHRPFLADFHPLYVIPGTSLEKQYGDRPCTELSPQEVELACATGFRKFYTRPYTAWQLASFILRRNPRYILRMGTPVKRLIIHAINQEKSLPGTSGAEQPATT